jgi:uncharacterized protein (TIGR02421 family)
MSVVRPDACATSAEPVRYDVQALDALQIFESKLGILTKRVRLLPAITAHNAPAERARLQSELQGDGSLVPRFIYQNPRPCLNSLRWIDQLRSEAKPLPGAALYLEKLEELELDLALLASLNDTRAVRPIAARRFGTGDELVEVDSESVSLLDYARKLLRGPRLRNLEAASIPADAPEGLLSLRAIVQTVAAKAGLEVTVRIAPNLTAGAATGERTVYLADRNFTRREAWRLALHEVLGHLVSAANGRAQPIRLLEWGTGFSFADQEGVALSMEAAFGLLDRGRLRSLCARVLATRAMHAGATFGETARLLFREYAFGATEAIAISERAYRGGGVARDAGYLRGFLRVRAALQSGETNVNELRMGRVGLSAMPELRVLREAGLLRAPLHRPNLSRSFLSTSSGTMPWRLPPKAAASLMSVELT